MVRNIKNAVWEKKNILRLVKRESEYLVGALGGVIMSEDTTYLLKCIECGAEFFTEGERDFYISKGLYMPKRCKECRNKKKYRYEQIQKEKELAEFLSKSTFKQIEKEELSLTDSKNTLFIIGNGFDLMHGVPSSYHNFRDSMGRHNELRNALEMYIRKEDLWADFEESLAHLDDEAMLGTVNDWMDIFDVKDQYDEDFSAADFFMAAETAMAPAQIIIRELPKRFRKWICTLNPTSTGKPLNRLINNQSTYITFNYTEFLEAIYGVPKNNIWYIHGDRRDKNKELILGHASGLEFEADNNTPMPRSRPSKIKNQTSYDLHETAGNHLGTYYHFTSKKSSDVIKTNKDRFVALSNMEDVIVIGHSLSSVDYPYFKEIIKYNSDNSRLRWYISWHSIDGLKKITKFVSDMNIPRSNIILFRT